MATQTAASLTRLADDLAPIILKYAGEAEANRTLARPVVDAMREAGLFRMFVPRALGGLEADAVEGFELIERISRLDSAAGWNLQIAAVDGASAGALLPPEGAEEVFADPASVVAGGFNPPGAAIPAEGGYRLSGRWGFASGCDHATWFVDPAFVMRDGQPEMGPDGQPAMLLLFYKASEGSIDRTWNPLGMRGTGSHHIAANDVFVPMSRSAPLRPFEDLPPAYAGPFYKLGMMPTILGNAVVALGIARAAIDEAVELTRSRIAAFNQPAPVNRGVVHMHLARAEAALSSARAYFYSALGDAAGSAANGSRPTMEQRLHLQLAASHAADASATAVDHIHNAVGSSGVGEDQGLFAQHFRDVHTITQHALCSAARFESMGQVMLGLPTEWGFVYL